MLRINREMMMYGALFRTDDRRCQYGDVKVVTRVDAPSREVGDDTEKEIIALKCQCEYDPAAFSTHV